MLRKPNLKIESNADGSADIWILDDIGPTWLGMVGAKGLAEQLEALGDVKTLNVHINSMGGDAFEGQAIHSLLAKHPAEVVVDVEGAALSAAATIAMAGDKIRMAKHAILMIHNPWTIAAGESEDLRKTADVLDKVKGSIAGILADRSGNDVEAVAELMDAETWMNAEEAVEAGFATELIVNKTADNSALASAVERYQNAPEWAKQWAEGRSDCAENADAGCKQQRQARNEPNTTPRLDRARRRQRVAEAAS